MPAFGNAAGKHFLQQSSWPYNTSNKRVTYHLFHHHGDAFLTLYTEEPMDLTIVHAGSIPYGSNVFNITADIGSTICLYRNGEILHTATGTGSVQAIPIPALPLAANVTLTVTKQNYFRHEELIPVETVLAANFEADVTSTCAEGAVSFTDLSSGDATSWLWTFEGGDPATSTDQNPTGIMYNTFGVYDVTLEISNASSSDTYTMEDYITVIENVEVGATVYSDFTEICDGEEVTFNVEVDNGGTDPIYQWKLNGVDVGDGTDVYVNSELVDGDMVSCEVTSSIECVIENPVLSNAVAMVVNEILTPSISIETEATYICEGDEVTFTAISMYEGENPIYQWKLNGNNVGENSPEFMTADLIDGDIVSCELTSDAECLAINPVMSNDIVNTVYPFPGELSTPNGPVEVDIYETPASEYATTEDPNTTEYVWTVSPENAYDELTVDMFNLTVTWAESFSGQASINVIGNNDCGSGPVSADIEVLVENTTGIGENELNIGVSVFPNPNNGTFTVKLSSDKNETVRLTIRNIVGETVYSEKDLTVNGEFVKVIDLSTYAEGIYFLMLENNNKVLTEKIVVQQ